MSHPTAPRVGDRTLSRHACVADVLAEAGVTLPDGSALLGPVVADLLLTPPAAAAARERFSWTTHDAIGPDDSVHASATTTRVAPATDHTILVRHVHLLDDAGTVRAESVETWHLAATLPAHPATDFCTTEWGALLRDSLAEDTDFASSLSTWDGTIGLRCDDREVHLRVYRGRVIDVTRRAPGGATFTFVAPGHTWAEVILDQHDTFMRRAIAGEFSSTGDGYEYLRLTKPLGILIAHARTIAREARP